MVPNPLVGQWAMEFYRFFPNANLLVSTVEDFTPKNRNRYVSKIATGEYDAVILAHSQFEKSLFQESGRSCSWNSKSMRLRPQSAK